MPVKLSAGLLMYRFNKGQLEVLLGHPGGPYYTEKDDGYWEIPKGEREAGERLSDTAIREFSEETGLLPDFKNIIPLGSVLEDNKKLVCIWAFPGNCEIPYPVKSNMFGLEWPKGSGHIQLFPELDKLNFFPSQAAIAKIEPVQREFISRLETRLTLNRENLAVENYRAVI